MEISKVRRRILDNLHRPEKEKPGIDGGMNVVPRMAIPGIGWLAYCDDIEGNIFGIMHSNPRAD